MTAYLIVIVVGYVIGAIPVGLIAGKLIKGIDIRERGSGKLGATNVLRTIGRPAAAVVLLLDMGKGASAVLIARIVSDSVGAQPAGALAALVGHNWPVFTGFKGGRGTATGLGGLLLMAPWVGLAVAVAGVSTLVVSRYVSLGSLVGAVVGGLTLGILSVIGVEPIEYIYYATIGAFLIIFSHKDNVGRLLAGTERKLGEPAEPLSGAAGRAEKSGKGA